MTLATRAHYKPGEDLTGVANSAIVAARFLVENGTFADGSNLPVEHCGGGAGTAGVPDYVSGQDAPNVGDLLHMYGHEDGLTVEIESSATIAAGVFIKVGAAGKAAAAGGVGDVVVGKVLRGGNNGDRLLVRLLAPAVFKIS